MFPPWQRLAFQAASSIPPAHPSWADPDAAMDQHRDGILRSPRAHPRQHSSDTGIGWPFPWHFVSQLVLVCVCANDQRVARDLRAPR
jgi:hypothetical protein